MHPLAIKARGGTKQKKGEERTTEGKKRTKGERREERWQWGEKKEGREPHQHCQRHLQLINYFLQQPLPLSITNTPALHNGKEKKGGKRRDREGKREEENRGEGGEKQRGRNKKQGGRVKKGRREYKTKERKQCWNSPSHCFFVCNCKGEGLLTFFKTAVSVIKLRETGKNTNTSSKEKQKKMTNQRNWRKSKRKGENIGPKHAAAWVLLPGNSSFAR